MGRSVSSGMPLACMSACSRIFNIGKDEEELVIMTCMHCCLCLCEAVEVEDQVLVLVLVWSS